MFGAQFSSSFNSRVFDFFSIFLYKGIFYYTLLFFTCYFPRVFVSLCFKKLTSQTVM